MSIKSKKNKKAFTPLNTRKTNLMGFTLIELLVVIAVIGLLSTIAFAALHSSREKAKIAQAQHDIDQLHKIILINYNESNGTSPTPSNTGIGTGCAYWGPGTVVGFVNNPGDYYKNWMGPFLSIVSKDPWGNCYVIDGPVNESCPGSPCGAMICSSGPNGSFGSGGGDDDYPWNKDVVGGDNICKCFRCP